MYRHIRNWLSSLALPFALGLTEAHAYIHPGAPLTLSDLQAVKANVDANREPWKSGYASLAAGTQLTYTMQGPFAQVSRVGAYDQNLAEWRSDMNAVWNFARMWYFTGDTAYAQKGHDILLAWANTQTEFSGNESMLDLGDYAYKFVGGADILRGTWPGWTAADTTAVKAYFANVLQPAANPWGESMYGAANKGALALVAQGLMAIFNDDTAKLDDIAYQARTLAHVGLRSSNDIGMLGDSLRDQGHGQVQLFSLTVLAEALWKQGIDIYPDYNNRLLAAGEYYARVNDLSVATPFLPFGTTDAYYTADVTNRGFHAGNTAFNILHNAYVVRKGIPAPWMTRRLQEMPVSGDSFMFMKEADFSTAAPAPALAIPATTSITSGFSEAELGGASPDGCYSSYSGGTWTVAGRGLNIWSTGDSCHFTYQAVTGDCAIIAKVESVQYTHAGARAGVMIRTSLSDGAPRAWMAVTPSSQLQQNIQGLAVYGGSNYGNKSYAIPQSSYWVKLERLGNMVTGSVSQDGTNWAATDVGRLDNPPATWYVGLVVSSTSGSLNTCSFSNVQITGGDGGASAVTPDAPAAFLAAGGENVVALRWQPSLRATSYTVKRATTSGGTYSTVASGVTASSYTDKTVTNGTTYYYVVTAVNSAGTSDSPEDSATPVRPMVNLAFGGTADCSVIGNPTAEGSATAFDRNSASKWYNGNTSPSPTGWLSYDFGAGNAQTVKRYTVVSADVANRDPKTWTFQGSNDGSTWTTLDTQSNQVFLTRIHANTYNLGNTTAYRYYQIDVTANNGATTLAIAELGLWSDTGRTVPDGTYRVISKNSKKVLDVTGNANGAPVVQQTFEGGDSQQWTLAWQGNGGYRATNVSSTKVLDNGGTSNAGTNLVIQPSSGGNSQLWKFAPDGDGFYRIESANSSLVADVSGGSTADGANMIQGAYSGSDSQQWMPAVAPAPLPIPPAPTGLGATAVSISQINLSWTINPGAISYKVKRATVSGGPYTTIFIDATGTSYPDTGLTASTTYYYVLSAVNGSGESTDSAQASATTPTAPPDAPIGLSAILGTNRATLSWTISGGATSYNVKRSTTPGGSYSTVATGLTGTNYIDTGLTSGVIYYYVVNATNAIGTGPDSAEVSVGAGPLSVHLKFDESGGPIATDSGGGDHDATLVNAPGFVAGTLDNALTFPATSAQHAMLPSGIVSGLTDFTIATWIKVDAIATWQRIFDFGSGTGNYMYLTTQYTATAPNAAKLRFVIRVNSGTEQNVSGTNIALATGVWTHVAVTRSGNTVSLYINGTLAGSGSITLSPADLGFTTQNYLGRSQFSADPYLNSALDDIRIYNQALSAGQITTLAHPPAGAPTRFAAAPGDTQATLTWVPNATTTYTVKRSTTSGGPYAPVATGVTDLTYTDIGLTNGVTYYYVVSGANDLGSGPDSAEVSVTPSTLGLHLKFDETGGTVAADTSGRARHATLVNGPTFAAGKINNGLTVTATSSQYATLPSGIVSGLTDFTISTWVKVNAFATWQRIFDFGTGTSNNMFLATQYTTTAPNAAKLRFGIRSTTVGEQSVSGTGIALATGTWTHVAVTRTGTTVSLYVNGSLAGTGTITLSPTDLGTTTQNYLGKSQFADPYLDGSLDDFRIFGQALSATEIAAYSAPLAAPQNFTATPGHSQIALSWDAVSGASGYTIRRADSSNGSYSDLVLEIPSTSYTDTGLSDGTTWYFTVAAQGSSGEGQASDPVVATSYTTVESWRVANFGTTSNSGNAADSADPDGDGMTNAEEYVAGTNPNSAASVLRIDTVAASANDIVVSFPSVSGKTYRLERSDTLENGSWTIVQGNIAGTGGIVQITDFGAAGQSKRFYRIVTP